MSWAGSMDLKHCLLDLKSSTIVSSSKVQHAAKVSLDYAHEYKFVVHAIENFIWKNTVEFRFAGFCVLDSIVRQSHGKNKEKDVFAPRFSKRMKQTLCAMKETSVRDQNQVGRMVSDWQEKGFFTQQSLRESDGHFFIHLFRQNESNQRQDHVILSPKTDNDPDKFQLLLSLIKEKTKAQKEAPRFIETAAANEEYNRRETTYRNSTSRSAMEYGRNTLSASNGGYREHNSAGNEGYFGRNTAAGNEGYGREMESDRSLRWGQQSDVQHERQKSPYASSSRARERESPRERRSERRSSRSRSPGHRSSTTPHRSSTQERRESSSTQDRRESYPPRTSSSSRQPGLLEAPRSELTPKTTLKSPPKHPRNVSTVTCRYFLAGRCKNGETCRFFHGKVVPPKGIRNTRMCVEYRTLGYCYYGDRCHSAHHQSDLVVIAGTSAREANSPHNGTLNGHAAEQRKHGGDEHNKNGASSEQRHQHGGGSDQRQQHGGGSDQRPSSEHRHREGSSDLRHQHGGGSDQRHHGGQGSEQRHREGGSEQRLSSEQRHHGSSSDQRTSSEQRQHHGGSSEQRHHGGSSERQQLPKTSIPLLPPPSRENRRDHFTSKREESSRYPSTDHHQTSSSSLPMKRSLNDRSREYHYEGNDQLKQRDESRPREYYTSGNERKVPHATTPKHMKPQVETREYLRPSHTTPMTSVNELVKKIQNRINATSAPQATSSPVTAPTPAPPTPAVPASVPEQSINEAEAEAAPVFSLQYDDDDDSDDDEDLYVHGMDPPSKNNIL